MAIPKVPKMKVKENEVFLPDVVNKVSVIKEVTIDSDHNIVKSPSVSLEGEVGKRVSRKRYNDLPNGHWDFEGDMRLRKVVGFIYVIKDLATGKLYLGKKSYVGAGKLNRGRESNWKWYISSSKALSASIKENGKDNFVFYCIEEYEFKGSLSFAETWSLCHVEALTNRDKWYNGLIGKVSWTVKEKVTDRHKRRLQQVIDGEI